MKTMERIYDNGGDLTLETKVRVENKRDTEYGIEGYIYTDVPDRTGRLKGLGNAVVPQVAYLVGRAVMEFDKERTR